MLRIQMPSVSRDSPERGHDDGIGDAEGGFVEHFEHDEDEGGGSLTGISELSSIPADVNQMLFEEEDEEEVQDNSGGVGGIESTEMVETFAVTG